MKKVTLIFTCIVMSSFANAQVVYCDYHNKNEIDSLLVDWKKMVDQIDQTTLYKTMVSLNSSGKTYQLPTKNNLDSCSIYLYFDSAGVLRKSKTLDSGSENFHQRYFNDEGLAIHSLYYRYNPKAEGYSISRYMEKECCRINLDFKSKNDAQGGILLQDIKKQGAEYSTISVPIKGTYARTYDTILNIDSLKQVLKLNFGIDSLYKPTNSIAVKFIRPQIGDTTFVNHNSVPLYPHLKSITDPMLILDVGQEVKVLDVDDLWYKVEYLSRYPKTQGAIGYLKKEYLAPIEINCCKN